MPASARILRILARSRRTVHRTYRHNPCGRHLIHELTKPPRRLWTRRSPRQRRRLPPTTCALPGPPHTASTWSRTESLTRPSAWLNVFPHPFNQPHDGNREPVDGRAGRVGRTELRRPLTAPRWGGTEGEKGGGGRPASGVAGAVAVDWDPSQEVVLGHVNQDVLACFLASRAALARATLAGD